MSRCRCEKGQGGNPAFTWPGYAAAMRTNILGKVGLAAVILFAPGGFILGAAMAADHYRRKKTARAD